MGPPKIDPLMPVKGSWETLDFPRQAFEERLKAAVFYLSSRRPGDQGVTMRGTVDTP